MMTNSNNSLTQEVYDNLANVYDSLTVRVDRYVAMKYIFQYILNKFTEDIGGYFQQQVTNNRFNYTLFDGVTSIELDANELQYFSDLSNVDWSKVNLTIFGSILQYCMDTKKRHTHGSHYTSERDILKVVYPTVIHQWNEKFSNSNQLSTLIDLLHEISQFTVLDPACGSGNFLYVAFKELKRIERSILNKIHAEHSSDARDIIISANVSIKQFYGIDLDEYAVQLTKLTLLLANEYERKKIEKDITGKQIDLNFKCTESISLDSIDDNIRCTDALFINWVCADVIIGNPPFLGGRILRSELGDEYVNKLKATFPNVKGQCDLCVYWFQKAHIHSSKRVGLIGTNSITQGISRAASLDFVTDNGGYITNAITSQVWSGDANVHVSIVNWVKDSKDVPNQLILNEVVVSTINSSLKPTEIDVTKAHRLKENKNQSFESCKLAGKGFIITEEQAKEWMEINPKNKEVLKPMIDGSTLVNPNAKLNWVIDFKNMAMEEAMEYKEPFEHTKKYVKPTRTNNKVKQRRERWWCFGSPRIRMRKELDGLNWYFCLPKVAKYTCFQAIEISILPCEANMVVASDDFYILGILNSKMHIDWVDAQKSTLESSTRYTNTTCYETFPFPRNVKEKTKNEIRQIMTELENYRKQEAINDNTTITKIYNTYINDSHSKLYKLHRQLDEAVCEAYGWEYDVLKNNNEKLLKLNVERHSASNTHPLSSSINNQYYL